LTGSTSAERADRPLLLTIGHSNRALPAFLEMLAAHDVARIADVRSAPYSRRHPQFNREALARALAAAGRAYAHMPDLGGMREPGADSRNLGIEPGGFRAYADHMESDAFVRACAALLKQARGSRIALMCAEADPANCHRSLLADALQARGASVVHLLDAAATRPHVLHPGAVVSAGRVHYPGAPDLFDPPRV
jgi:uncharacterized protein (DUF488 family)